MLLGFKAIVKTSAEIEHLALKTEDPFSPDLGPQLMRDLELTQKALRQYDLQHAV
jgi:hypothetical protein